MSTEDIQKEIINELIAAAMNQESQLEQPLQESFRPNEMEDVEIRDQISVHQDHDITRALQITKSYSYLRESSHPSDTEEEEQTQQETKEEEKEAEINNDVRTLELMNQFDEQGFSEWFSYQRYQELVKYLAVGFIRNNYKPDKSNKTYPYHDIGWVIIQFYKLSIDNPVQIQHGQKMYITLMANISLSKILVSRAKKDALNHIATVIVKLEEVDTVTFEHILVYLGHHKKNEVEFTAWTDGTSMDINQIVNDEWDTDWINTFDTNTLRSIKCAARHFKIMSLVQLAGIPMITRLFDLSRFL